MKLPLLLPTPGTLLALGFFACAAPLAAQTEAPAGEAPPDEAVGEEGSDYIRFVEDEAIGRLQTAVARFENAEGIRVDLIGAVHIADMAYYEKLNGDFTGYESLLYEMVGDPNAAVNPDAKPASSGNALRFFQNLMKNMLALDYQLDGIDYKAANFVHADMDWKTFTDLRKERGETMIGMMMKSWEYQAKKAVEGKPNATPNLGEMIRLLMSNDAPSAMKVVLGRQFRETEALMNGIEGEEGSVIIAERNKVALRVLRDRMEQGEKHLGIFYGAAHLPDLAKRLTGEMGFEAKGVDWNTAWEINKKETIAPAAEQPEEPSDAKPAPEAGAEPVPGKKAA